MRSDVGIVNGQFYAPSIERATDPIGGASPHMRANLMAVRAGTAIIRLQFPSRTTDAERSWAAGLRMARVSIIRARFDGALPGGDMMRLMASY